MSTGRVSRNDACPCGSGKKFKKCCLLRQAQPVPDARVGCVRPQVALNGSFDVACFDAANSRKHQQVEKVADGTPDPSTTPVLPVEIGLHYTFPEEFGTAEVTYIFPAGKVFFLPDGRPILNDELKPGMQVRLQDGAVATITAVHLYYEPPDPPCFMGDGLWLSRVIGTIKHKGFAVADVTWGGSTVTGTPDHRFYSVTRQAWVPAQDLRVGEFLRTADNSVAPVQAVSKPRYGWIELYNVEVERFHNFFVGGPDGGPGALVHNGTEYINTPGQARRFSNRIHDVNPGVSRFRLEQRNGKWVTVSQSGSVRSATGTHLFVNASGWAHLCAAKDPVRVRWPRHARRHCPRPRCHFCWGNAIFWPKKPRKFVIVE